MISIDISSKGSGRDKTGDDDTLWGAVTRDIKPLHKNNPVLTPKNQDVSKGTNALRDQTVPAPARIPLKPPVTGDREVDRRTAEKLRKGQYQIDVTLDLHGLTQAVAHDKLVETIKRSYARGCRCVLVITGKGRGEGQGVLKRNAPEWLQEESLRSIVLKVQVAKPEHGGGGAFYVLLRRQRPER